MHNETRITYRDGDVFNPNVEAEASFAFPGERLVRINTTSLIAQGTLYASNQLVLTLGLENAKLLVQKLQEGIDKHENEIGN